MKISNYLALLCILLASCSGKSREEAVTTPIIKVSDADRYYIKPEGDYATTRRNLAAVQKTYKTQYLAATRDSVRQRIIAEAQRDLTHHLSQKLFPFWYGTPWDFNGYTDEPGKGKIACGYFVSTTLLHAGFNLNRYTLAQQDPLHEALTITLSDSLITLTNRDGKDVKQYLTDNNLPDGLYFAGLDFHVGYLLKEHGDLFFIHSNYINATGVVIEPVEISRAFRSQHYYIGAISSNKDLIRKWILQEPVKVQQPVE